MNMINCRANSFYIAPVELRVGLTIECFPGRGSQKIMIFWLLIDMLTGLSIGLCKEK